MGAFGSGVRGPGLGLSRGEAPVDEAWGAAWVLRQGWRGPGPEAGNDAGITEPGAGFGARRGPWLRLGARGGNRGVGLGRGL